MLAVSFLNKSKRFLLCYNLLGDDMNKQAIFHQAKSYLSYAFDAKTLHLYLQTSREDTLHVSIIHGDPFEWRDVDGVFTWVHHIEPMKTSYQTSLFKYYFLDIKPPHKRVKYAFLIDYMGKRYLYGTQGLLDVTNRNLFETYDLSHYFNYPYLNHEDVMDTPLWSKNMVWYQIFPDRFYTDTPNMEWTLDTIENHDHFGGTLQGITQKLDYLEDLGIQGIYFTPIFLAPSMHKYDTTDYYQIDPQFGTNEDFKTLVIEAHKRNIKVMLDGVFNHAGFFHPYFQDVIQHGEQSMYKDCFFIHEYPVINFELDASKKPKRFPNVANRYETFGFTPMMPKWNTSHPIVEKHLLGVVEYWIKEFDIDGWRLDVSNEVSHDFLRKIRQTARRIKPDAFILGENWDASLPWLQGDQMDAVMNYDLSVPIWNFLEHTYNQDTLIEQLNRYLSRTPKHLIPAMFNLVCSHDTIRIKKRLGDDPRRMKLAYLLMFISAGSPNIYYGDEVGLTGFQDPNNRLPMIWDSKRQDLDMLQFMKRLITYKKTLDAFHVTDYTFIEDPNLLIIKKEGFTSSIVVIMNNSNEKVLMPQILNGYKILEGSHNDLITEYGFLLGVKQ